jgi:hypothetical protein
MIIIGSAARATTGGSTSVTLPPIAIAADLQHPFAVFLADAVVLFALASKIRSRVGRAATSERSRSGSPSPGRCQQRFQLQVRQPRVGHNWWDIGPAQCSATGYLHGIVDNAGLVESTPPALAARPQTGGLICYWRSCDMAPKEVTRPILRPNRGTQDVVLGKR